MLKSFVSLGAKPSSFADYNIAHEMEFVEKHGGKYYAVYLNLKECGGDTWEECINKFGWKLGLWSKDIKLI